MPRAQVLKTTDKGVLEFSEEESKLPISPSGNGVIVYREGSQWVIKIYDAINNLRGGKLS